MQNVVNENEFLVLYGKGLDWMFYAGCGYMDLPGSSGIWVSLWGLGWEAQRRRIQQEATKLVQGGK